MPTVTVAAEPSPSSDAPTTAGVVLSREPSDASRCEEVHETLATDADPSTTVRMVVWSDGLRCLAATPVPNKDALQREARRLADHGVHRAILFVDPSVPYGLVIEILDDLRTGGIRDIVFSASTRD